MLYKIVVVGAQGSGKSSLIQRFAFNNFASDYEPTLEDEFRKLCNVDDEPALLGIINTAPQETFSIYRPYLHGGQGFLVVYSITSRISFEAAQHFWETIKGAKPPGKAHIVLVGNKADLEFERQVGTDEGREFARNINCRFFETSALNDVNVSNAFHELVRLIRGTGNKQDTKMGQDLGDKSTELSSTLSCGPCCIVA
ncbi:ras protein [Panaeolus papilionaceus]|nr:ras protein [Panaeolus papilionaceus]